MSYILCIETGTDTCSVALARDGQLVALRESHGERDHAARVAVYTEEVLAEAGVKAGGGIAVAGGRSERSERGGCTGQKGCTGGSDGLGYSELSAVAVSKGPGSYTGLRIGVSFAKGLCYGLGIPLVGVGSLDSLCAVAMLSEKICFRQKCPDVRLATEPNEGHTEAYVTNSATSVTQQAGVFHENRPKLFIPMIDARRMEVFGQVFDSAGKPLTSPEAWVIDENSLAPWREVGNVYIFGSGAAKCCQALPWAHFIDIEPSARGMAQLAEKNFDARIFEDTAYFEPFYLKDFVITTSKKKLF